jgi:hypothetical protein
MSFAIKQEGAPDPVRDCGGVQDGDFEGCIPDRDWFVWFVMAIGSAALMLVAAAVWDWWR